MIRFHKVHWFFVLCFLLIISGCSGKRDILCDSSVTKDRVVNGIKQDFQSYFDDIYLSFLKDIHITDIVTTSADDVANTRNCEAIIAIHTKPNNNIVQQTISFTNQVVSESDVTSRTKFTQYGTLHVLRAQFSQAVEADYHQHLAHNAGFNNYNDMQLFIEAEKNIEKYEAEISAIDVQISLASKELEKLGDDVAKEVVAIKPAFEEGKSVMLTNSIIRMIPFEYEAKDSRFRIMRQPDSITAQIENITDFTLTNVRLEASFSAVVQDEVKGALLDGKIMTPLSPGEVTEVTIKIDQPPSRKSFSSFKPKTYSHIDWRNAKDIKIVFTPKSFSNPNKNAREDVFHQYVTHSVIAGRKIRKDILYNAFYDLSGSVKSLKKSKESVEAKLIETKTVLASIEKKR